MIIDGAHLASCKRNLIRSKVESLIANGKRIPCLAVIQVGDNEASTTYVKNKIKACKYTGIKSVKIKLPENVSENELLNNIKKLNKDTTIDGILVQLPLPMHIDEQKVINTINPDKDVDGFHPNNIAKLFLGKQDLTPCTPKGIITLLKNIGYNLNGKEMVIVGRSNIVGKPLALLALQKNATVTIAHSKTANLKKVCQRADVLVVAVGKANFIDKTYIKQDAIVIDVGINHDTNGKLCGDVNFKDVLQKAKYITPVPGGVGPMTIAMLLENTMKAYDMHEITNTRINIFRKIRAWFWGIKEDDENTWGMCCSYQYAVENAEEYHKKYNKKGELK